jgi:hypothetical protein
VTTSKFVTDPKGKAIEIKQKLTCQTYPAIYVIECKTCKMRYVGQTNASIHERLVGHRSDIKLKKKHQ